MKFYLDENISPKVAEIARARCGLDVVSAQEAGTHEWPDDRQLRYAASEGRCLVTRNRDDFLAETLKAFEAEAPHVAARRSSSRYSSTGRTTATGGAERTTRSAVAGRAFLSQPSLDLETLAAQQGVKPVADFNALLGDFWPEEETADEFIAAVRRWRREGGGGVSYRGRTTGRR